VIGGAYTFEDVGRYGYDIGSFFLRDGNSIAVIGYMLISGGFTNIDLAKMASDVNHMKLTVLLVAALPNSYIDVANIRSKTSTITKKSPRELVTKA